MNPRTIAVGLVVGLLSLGLGLEARDALEPLPAKCERYLDEQTELAFQQDEDTPVGIGYSACSEPTDDIIGVQCLKQSWGPVSELWIRCTRWGCEPVDLFDFGTYRIPAPVCNKPWAMAVIERRP